MTFLRIAIPLIAHRIDQADRFPDTFRVRHLGGRALREGTRARSVGVSELGWLKVLRAITYGLMDEPLD
jgi:hypothetical protein